GKCELCEKETNKSHIFFSCEYIQKILKQTTQFTKTLHNWNENKIHKLFNKVLPIHKEVTIEATIRAIWNLYIEKRRSTFTASEAHITKQSEKIVNYIQTTINNTILISMPH